MLEPLVLQEGPTTPIALVAPAFDESKLLIYRELYYDGFSSIIAARDLTTGTAVALKKVEYGFMSNCPFPIHKLQRRFSRKVRNQTARLRALSHNSVLKLVDFVIEPNKIVIVTEMCMFGDIFNWMLQQPQLRIRDISLVFQYVFEAIRYLHSQNFVHGFLSPTHVLFQAMSPQSVTIMPDLSVRNELIGLTEKTFPIVDCWAPECLEQIISSHSVINAECFSENDSIEEHEGEARLTTVTKPMDIWSAACIMHIALTGKPPFLGESLRSTLEVIRKSAGNLENPLLQTLGPRLRAQLLKWLCLNPDERPSVERSFDEHWFDDEFIRADCRNILLIVEYDLMHTCRRYRTRGRNMFETIFEK